MIESSPHHHEKGKTLGTRVQEEANMQKNQKAGRKSAGGGKKARMAKEEATNTKRLHI